MLLHALVASLLVLLPTSAWAWGEAGHRVVATIADRLLAPEAARQVRELLASDGAATLVDIATWADKIRHARPETARWHLVPIPLAAAGYDRARDCPGDQCSVAQLERWWRVLADRRSDRAARVEALKFVVNLTADLHQPMRCADYQDAAGSARRLRYFGRPTNLQAVWEISVVERLGPLARVEARLAESIGLAEVQAWQTGGLDAWADESHDVARQVAYGALPAAEQPDLGQAYQAAAAPAVELQLRRAGVRLARLLNDAFEPEKRPPLRFAPATGTTRPHD